MAGKIVQAAHQAVTAATAAGYVTVSDSTKFFPKAFAWLSGPSQILLDYNTKTAGWSVGETVTGETSGATGTIQSVVGGAPGAAAGTIVLTGVTGTFQAGEILDGSVSMAAAAKATAAQYKGAATIGTLYCQITDCPDGTHVGLRILTDPGVDATTGVRRAGPNYGRSDVSAFNGGGFLDMESQLIYVTNADNTLPATSPTVG